jgi:hypothetical protein
LAARADTFLEGLLPTKSRIFESGGSAAGLPRLPSRTLPAVYRGSFWRFFDENPNIF